ncbi:MAG: alpha-amylase family glycosyl hydrolase [Ferruginibacter sp.]
MIVNLYKKQFWINSTNVYEVNLRQYTNEGTISAFLKELPRLKDMGVETLWFMPITPIAQKNKKGSLGSYYACSDYMAVDPEFGTIHDFKQFVATAHDQGFKVIIDWVANHTGWDHRWTIDHPDFYIKDILTGDFKMASGMEDIIELNYENPALRNAMITAMEFWIHECDIDGFRCDLAFWVTVDFWNQARARIEKIKTLFWLAEADPIEQPQYVAPFDAMYTWEWMHKSEQFYKTNTGFYTLTNLLNEYNEACGNTIIPVWFTTNHDENSWNGTEYEKYGAMSALLTVFSFTWNGIPLIYSGQEAGNLKRLQFFEKDVIEWNGYKLHDFYKTLLNLRKKNKALIANDRSGSTYILPVNDLNVLAFFRKNRNDEVWVLLNFSKDPVSFLLVSEHLTGAYDNVFNSGSFEAKGNKQIDLNAWEYLLFQRNNEL